MNFFLCRILWSPKSSLWLSLSRDLNNFFRSRWHIWQHLFFFVDIWILIVDLPYDNSMSFDWPVVVVQSQRVAAGVNIQIKNQLFTNDTFWIKGNEKSICQFANNCVFHGLIYVVRHVILLLVNFQFVFARLSDPFRVVVITHYRFMHLVCFGGL